MDIKIQRTNIPGLLQIDLKVAPDPDGRGWGFLELMQLEKLKKAGFTERFQVVQSNVSNSIYGTIRGIHAEPWNKLIVPINGEIFVAIVDLRPGSHARGQVVIFERLDRHTALFIPKGCGNSFAALSPSVDYFYNVDAHWRPNVSYPSVAYDDPFLNIPWPIPPDKRIISAKDQRNPPYVP